MSRDRSDRRDLTPRELQVLAHVANGYQDKEIAKILGIAYDTVKGIMVRVLVKMDCLNRTHAAVTACRMGWL